MERMEMLVGEELNAVSFVMDYVEFHFNDPVLRALNPPELRDARNTSRFPEPGSRDALCTLIGARVAAIQIGAEEIEVRFTDDRALAISLVLSDDSGPEAA